MKKHLIFLLVFMYPLIVFSQNVEIEGKLKIKVLDEDITTDSIVIMRAGGELARRHLSSLPDQVNDADSDPNNERQDLILFNDTLSITNNLSSSNIDLSIYKNNLVKIGKDSLAITLGDTVSLNSTRICDTDQDTYISTEISTDSDEIDFYVEGNKRAYLDNKTFHLDSPGGSIFIGVNAGSNDNGSFNECTFVGYESGSSNTSGKGNTAVGKRSFNNNETGNSNSAFGKEALRYNTIGSYNVAIGLESGFVNNGNNNVLLGYRSGFNNSVGNNNIFLGFQSGYLEMGSNKLYIENSASSNPLIYGEFDTGLVAINGKLGISTQTPTVSLQVEGGSDATLASGGYLISGSPISQNIVMDNNEIMSRSNGSPSTLFLQNDGGSLSVHGSFTEIKNFVIDDDARTGIGENNPSDKLHVNSDSGEDAFRVQTSGSTKFRIYQNGTINVGFNGANTHALNLQNNSVDSVGKAKAYAWETYSDQRVKSNIRDLDNGIDKIMAMNPKSYSHHSSKYNEDGTYELIGNWSTETIGFIAQEMYDVLPEAVSKPDHEDELWSIDYSKVIPILVKAMQEQQEEIEILKMQIEKLRIIESDSKTVR